MIDINPNYDGISPDRYTGDRALVESALFNLLNTTPGENSQIFNADVGSFWRVYLQEPICDTTAAKIQLEIFESIQKWLPTVTLVRGSSYVAADMHLPGYRVTINYLSLDTQQPQTINFEVPV